MSDAVSLGLLADLKIRELSQRPPAARPPSDDEPSPAPRPALATLTALPRLVAEAVMLLLAVRIQIVIAR